MDGAAEPLEEAAGAFQGVGALDAEDDAAEDAAEDDAATEPEMAEAIEDAAEETSEAALELPEDESASEEEVSLETEEEISEGSGFAPEEKHPENRRQVANATARVELGFKNLNIACYLSHEMDFTPSGAGKSQNSRKGSSKRVTGYAGWNNAEILEGKRGIPSFMRQKSRRLGKAWQTCER